MNATFLRNFPQQLRYWSLHSGFNALPSFIIALVHLKLWKTPQAVAAMLLAIALFIVAYAVSTSFSDSLSDKSHVLGRSIRLGTRIRTWIACLSVPLTITPGVFFAPDFWCGFIAAGIYNQIARLLRNPAFSGGDFGIFENGKFIPVFAVTILEGLIISFLLLMISFFCVIFLQSRERRKFQSAGRACVPE